jgi:L-fuculose-phosphate aldolase
LIIESIQTARRAEGRSRFEKTSPKGGNVVVSTQSGAVPYDNCKRGSSIRCRSYMPSEREFRREIVLWGKALHERGYVAAMDGNLSVRLDERRILATPTSMSKGLMRPADMVIVDLDGHRLAGRRNVSSEIAMHLLIYKLRPDVRGVVHAHPPTATGFAAAAMPLNQPLVCEVVIGLGSIPLARYGTPGTPELSDALAPLIPEYDAILMSNHGVVAYGDTLHHAYMKMETVEHFAQIALVTHLLGRQNPLSAQELEKLMVARSKYQGTKSAAALPIAMVCDGGNHHDGKQPAAQATPSESTPKRRVVSRQR